MSEFEKEFFKLAKICAKYKTAMDNIKELYPSIETDYGILCTLQDPRYTEISNTQGRVGKLDSIIKQLDKDLEQFHLNLMDSSSVYGGRKSYKNNSMESH